MSTGFHRNELYAWHDTGTGSGSSPPAAWSSPSSTARARRPTRRSSASTPYIEAFRGMGYMDLQHHQEAVIEAAAGLLKGVPAS